MTATPIDVDPRMAWTLRLTTRQEPGNAHVTTDAAGPTAPDPVRCAREVVAIAVAEIAGVRAPSQRQTIELLSELVVLIQKSGVLDAKETYLTGGLYDFGWPIDPEERLIDNVIAAADIGLFDPPGAVDQVQLEISRPFGGTDGEGRQVIGVSIEGEGAFVRANRDRDAQPDPEQRRTVNEQFLHDWECLLGAITDCLVEELASDGYVNFGPG